MEVAAAYWVEIYCIHCSLGEPIYIRVKPVTDLDEHLYEVDIFEVERNT